MATKSKRLVPARAVHPGEILGEELRERKIKQKDFAKALEVQASHLNEFIKGKRNLTIELAKKLEDKLGISSNTWLNLHFDYLSDLEAINERSQEEVEAIEYEKSCSRILNIKIIYKYLGISEQTTIERVNKLKEMFPFDLQDSERIATQIYGMYKRSDKAQINDKNMLTWVALNRLKVSSIMLENPYKQGNALLAADDIARMANKGAISEEKIKECLNRYGIAYIVLQKLEKAPIDAYSMMSNGHPCITVTHRYNDLDKLTFDVLHELCHIDRHLNDEERAFISGDNTLYSTDPKEKEANDFARNKLIPDEIWARIMRVKGSGLSPYAIMNTIAREANRFGVSQSIAISRYKFETGNYKTTKYKSPKIHN